MSDTLLEPELIGPPIPNTYNPILLTSGIKPGMVVSASTTPNSVVAGNAAAAATAHVTGLYLGPAPSTGGKRGNVRYSGIVALEIVEWVAATVEAIALITGTIYYQSSGHPGKITATPPGGEGDAVVQVGVALSPTSLLVQVGPPGAAGPPGPPAVPTVEHVTTGAAGGFAANNAVASPTVNVTFITEGGDADGRQVVSLANGSTDGFEKTIAWPQGAIPVLGYRVVPASGPTVNWGDTDGAVTYRWNATAVAWEVQSAYKSV